MSLLSMHGRFFEHVDFYYFVATAAVLLVLLLIDVVGGLDSFDSLGSLLKGDDWRDQI